MCERSLQLLGAPTNLGLKPYDGGSPRRVDEAPALLRRLGLVERLDASDLGDVAAAAYTDFERPENGIRNGPLIAAHAVDLAEAVARAVAPDDHLIVIGGDCSVLLGIMLGLHRRGRYGLVFVDGHCDFATPALSATGGAAGMDLALAVGQFDHPLARLASGESLVREEDVVALARKDLHYESHFGASSIRHTGIADLPLETLRRRGLEAVIDETRSRVTRAGLDGFWVHFDVDVLHPDVMSAVDAPEPDGLSLEEATRLLRRLMALPQARGIDVTIYDPGLDPNRTDAQRLADLLVTALTHDQT